MMAEVFSDAHRQGDVRRASFDCVVADGHLNELGDLRGNLRRIDDLERCTSPLLRGWRPDAVVPFQNACFS
jgi:hypothetical protein